MILTNDFRAVTWTNNYSDLFKYNSFSNYLLNIKEGLYVMLFVNPYDTRVRDNNTNPKTVIQPNGCSLKFGKFEGDLIKRIHNYYIHLRIDVKSGPKQVFPDCFQYLFVFDTTGFNMINNVSNSRLLEHIWNEKIKEYLQHNKLLVSGINKKGEWQDIQNMNNSQINDLTKFLEALRNILEDLLNGYQTSIRSL